MGVFLPTIRIISTFQARGEIVKASMLLLAASLVAFCSDSGNSEDAAHQECNNLVAERVEGLSAYEFTTIKNVFKVEYVESHAIAFYNVDYEYSGKSVLFVTKYDGDIFGDVAAWFINVDEQVFIRDVGLSEKASNESRIFVEYQDSSGRTCRENLRLP